ncbi:MAG: YicC family protein [Cytophagales bacterium]|nr:YicC family protein [Cytophagales bacterium]MDW8383927.1 YicC/YloC family endoribonuclease [Flammeovirgaceae bacterium]
MLKSMTGFGAFQVDTEKYTLAAEIRSLNSNKGLDVSLRVSNLLSSREAEIKNMIANGLERGKIHCVVSIISKDASLQKLRINSLLAEAYYREIKSLADRLQAPSQDLLRIVMLMPDVVSKETENDTEECEEIWESAQYALEKSIIACNEFRLQEGKMLAQKLLEYIHRIEQGLLKIEHYEPQRIVRIREKLRKHMEEWIRSEHFDGNRFEQELIYYIEKLDISEEKVRLRTHLNYFVETIQLDSEHSHGKKLGFIAQEIGREINTIGSKANDADIQRIVIEMKEELEKIKEQSLNIL